MGGNHAVMQWEEIMLQWEENMLRWEEIADGRKTCCKHTRRHFIQQSKIIQDVFSYIKLRL